MENGETMYNTYVFKRKAGKNCQSIVPMLKRYTCSQDNVLN